MSVFWAILLGILIGYTLGIVTMSAMFMLRDPEEDRAGRLRKSGLMPSNLSPLDSPTH
jgi:hypothetical protein